ncbi:TANK-binding kinase 1-binding protein 1-like [Hippoglossus hippoglossus]|uniref:TANK-binding kinase 1-binding protein 1-like n=1 Tax=Hippoglossus hippoglossus TaxID=8267 RepID=UPI00148B34D2|nr:TANK-binding kinase 1-binding protein 1-like [Hippoglossus hippoglossus]XP_035037399.1 TANK-binding kinase 1-binding protein 1 isoform X2 [Hippoglossus stenolepis]
MMDLYGRGELGLLGGGESLRDDMGGSGITWSANRLSEDMYPSSGLALAAAYHDIKTRLASLERENSSIKRKLKHYEFPMISEFGEERIVCCSCEPIIKDASVIQSETTNLQQRINSLTQELQKSKEREERLEEVIQAYEKIHLEKSNVQRDLDKMTTLAEQHVERICSLESALRQRETSLQKIGTQLRSKEARQSQLHASLDVPREGRGPTLQSSRSLDALSDLKLQRLEAELDGARHQAEGACQREKEMRVELQRLQQEASQLQKAQRQSQELAPHCEHCDVEWIKKAGDEQVNLALAYTELTEELGRVRNLAAKQSDLLRHVSQEPGSRPPATPQRLSPTSPQRPSLSPERLLPTPSPPLSLCDSPASYSQQPTSSRLRAKFQGRRSYSEVSDPSAIHRPPARLMRDPVSTLPKPRPLLGETQGYSQNKHQLRTALLGLVRPASAHGGERGGGGGGRERAGGSSLTSSPHHCALDLGFPRAAEGHHFCRLDDPPEPTPLVTPPQSSDDEEDVCAYLSPADSPPRTLGAIGILSSSPREQPLHPSFPSPRKQPHHPSFSAPEGPATLSCHLPPYMNTEHAQSWPSINLWMESEESAVRSCPLCQLTFPTGYPDDALIKHIDSHLENSKI